MEKDESTVLQYIALIAVIAFFGYNKIHDHVDPPDWAIFLFIAFAFIGKKVSNLLLKLMERIIGK